MIFYTICIFIVVKSDFPTFLIKTYEYENTFIRRLVHCTHECSPLGVWCALVNRDKNILTTQRLFGAWGKLLTIEQRDIDIYVVKKIIDLYNWEALDTIHISKATENRIVIF